MLDARKIPIDLQTAARLFGRPKLFGDNGDASAFRQRDLENIEHAFDASRVIVDDALDPSAKDRRMSDHCHFHSRQIEVQSEFQRAVAFRTAVETFDSLANEPKLRWSFQVNFRWHRFACSIGCELGVSRGLVVWSKHLAGFSATLVRSRVPTIGSRGDEHRASLRAELAILLKRVRDRTRAADHLHAKQR